MWSTKIRNIWDALYPVALYVVVSDCVYMLLTLAIGENTISPMALQILTALLSSPSIVYPYFSDRRGQPREMRGKEAVPAAARLRGGGMPVGFVK